MLLWLAVITRQLPVNHFCLKCIKTFFGFTRRGRGSVTQILFNLGLPSFNTVLHKLQ